MVYCPLCLSEFRPGFRTCSDCHAALVPTLENSESGGARLRKGDREEQLDRILGTLEEQNIPFHFHEMVNHPSYLLARVGNSRRQRKANDRIRDVDS
jgi:hypothetical protein